ncbi:MAG: hypothetical protein KDK55_01880 [Chlamydiia bacterium]|nr:hypothetical protein [Chlamydiia bacterium]
MRTRVKDQYRRYFLLALSLFSILVLPAAFVQKFRALAISFLSPCRQFLPPAIYQDENAKLKSELAVLKKRLDKLNRQISDEIGISATVIYRDPMSWSSSFWIDVGERTNHTQQIVAKNSPVLIGDSIIGAIDYVGKTQSRVRLITDSGLNPSVRAVRGNTSYLAKGVLQGTGPPLWRGRSPTLKGIGFNYDFDDTEGSARDLVTGAYADPFKKGEAISLIKEGDLLVTTGMDGVFPAGLKVAVVTKIFPLKEGDYTYSLEAKPTAAAIEDICFVYVTPPIGFNMEEG